MKRSEAFGTRFVGFGCSDGNVNVNLILWDERIRRGEWFIGNPEVGALLLDGGDGLRWRCGK